MFVILCYDVKESRCEAVRKTACKYLRAAQESVFEGFLSDNQVSALKRELLSKIDPDEDSIILYKYVPGCYFTKDEVGVRRITDPRFL